MDRDGNTDAGREVRRQAVHFFLCMSALGVLFFFSRNWVIGITFAALVAGSLLINVTMRDRKLRLVQWFVSEFEREGVRLPGWGAACLATGVLILAAYLNETPAIAAGLMVLGIGDGLSTLVGMRGTHPLPWNGRKTLEGSLAFFAGALSSWIFVGPLALPLAAAAALGEGADIGIDDNLVIPIMCVIVLSVL